MCVLTLKISHRPDGKIAHVLAPTHACTTANAPVNYSRYVPQRPCKVPIAPMGRWLTCPNRLSSFNSDRYLVLSGICTCQPRLQTSHRPHGRLTTFACCLQGGGVYVGSGTVTITSSSIYGNTAYDVRAHVQKVPSPQWATRVLLVVCRVVVSVSGEAQCQS